MKAINAILLIIGCCLPLLTWSQSDENSFTVPLSDAASRGKLHVDIHRGTVSVKGTTRKDVLVKYEAIDKEDKRITDAGNGLRKISGGGINMEIAEKRNNVYVEADSRSKAVKIYVEVPVNFDLNIDTHHYGDVDISNIEGEIVVEGHHGGISAKDVSGSVVANTWHGDVEVTFKRISPDTPLAFTTYHGKIDLSLPAATKANLKLKSSRGEIFTGFDVELIKQTLKKEAKSGSFKVTLDDWVTGAINGGGPEIIAKTNHDNIYIRKM